MFQSVTITPDTPTYINKKTLNKKKRKNRPRMKSVEEQESVVRRKRELPSEESQAPWKMRRARVCTDTNVTGCWLGAIEHKVQRTPFPGRKKADGSWRLGRLIVDYTQLSSVRFGFDRRCLTLGAWIGNSLRARGIPAQHNGLLIMRGRSVKCP